jgi:hypothetical protein
VKKLAILAILVLGGVIWTWGNQIEFFLGGAMINIGYRLQDHLDDYDLKHHELNPNEIWTEFMAQNQAAAATRHMFPRTARHPVIAMVACMDARIDTNEIAGDTRRYSYVLRLAGSVLSEKEEEMLELAVANGVKVVVFTTHTDCAAEKVAADPERRKLFPRLSAAVDERSKRFDEFLARPVIQQKVAAQSLLVKWMDLDTSDGHVSPHKAE